MALGPLLDEPSPLLVLGGSALLIVLLLAGVWLLLRSRTRK